MPDFSIIAPSRLHFGLLAFEHPERTFGGVGAMIDEPRLEIQFRESAKFAVSGEHTKRATAVARQWAEAAGWVDLPNCEMEINNSASQHAGLGLGTQLSLAIATGLCLARGEAPPPSAIAAPMLGRCGRSSIGAHGFAAGGIMLDGGHRGESPLGRLEQRHDTPADWRWVLIRTDRGEGVSGEQEAEAFSRVKIAPETTDALYAIATEQLFHALTAIDFATFSESLYEYGVRAGKCFAEVQGGPFASETIATVVAKLRDMGVVGCGQSSWGPTVYALTESQAAAEQFIEQLTADRRFAEMATTIAKPNNQGATISS